MKYWEKVKSRHREIRAAQEARDNADRKIDELFYEDDEPYFSIDRLRKREAKHWKLTKEWVKQNNKAKMGEGPINWFLYRLFGFGFTCDNIY